MLTLTPSSPFAHLSANSPARGRRGDAFLQSPKVKDWQVRMQEAIKTTDRLGAEQAELKKTAIRMEKGQAMLDKGMLDAENLLENRRVAEKLITAELPQISKNILAIEQVASQLSQKATAIQQDQEAIALTFNVLDKQYQAIHVQASTIQSNNDAVQQSLEEAAKKIDHIEKDADMIKADHQAMSVIAEQIEEKKEDLQQKIPQLQNVQVSSLKADEIKKEVVSKVEAVGFWSSLMQKIINFSSWIFTTVISALGGGKVNLKNWLVSHHIHSASDAAKHPAAWTLIGLSACMVVQNAIFSAACLGLGGSLYYYRWRNSPQAPQNVGAHAA